MSDHGTYLDCGCYISAEGVRTWCPTCTSDLGLSRASLGDDKRDLVALRLENERLREALDIMRKASYQGHSAHWDPTMGHGAGCPQCHRADDLRAKADAIVAALTPSPGLLEEMVWLLENATPISHGDYPKWVERRDAIMAKLGVRP